MAADPGDEPPGQPPAPSFPRRAWLLGPVAFTIFILGARIWEIFIYSGLFFGIAFVVAFCEYLWILLAYQGHRKSVASRLLTVFWAGIALTILCLAWGNWYAWVAARLCTLVSASVSVVMFFACRRRRGDAAETRQET